MKKVSFIKICSCAIIAIILCVSCKTKNQNSSGITEYEYCYDFEECIRNANNYMSQHYGDTNYYFYEAQVEMSLPFRDSNFYDSARVYEIQTFFQLKNKDKVIKIVYPNILLNIDSVQVTEYDGVWKDDLPMKVNDITITLDSAITRLFESKIDKPAGNKIVVRKPDIDTIVDNPYFFFGCDSSYVVIDIKNN